MEKKWGYTLQNFTSAFDRILIEGEGTKRLKNVYILYLKESKPLSKVLPFSGHWDFQLFTGNEVEDSENKVIPRNISQSQIIFTFMEFFFVCLFEIEKGAR